MNKQITLLAFLLALTAFRAAAQTPVQVLPPNPTAGDDLTLRFTNAAGVIGPSVTQVGNHFRVDFGVCPILCFGILDYPIGTLPAGTYTYEIFVDSQPSGSGSFSVAAVPGVPTLSPTALASLCLLLIGVGWFALARQT